MANIFPIDFEEKLTMAQDDYILFSDSEDGNKIKKAQYKNLKGDKGDTGATGTAATITVGSTTTGDAGTSASVTNSGTSSAAVLNFTIPKGAKGDTGATGATGNGIASITSSKSGDTTTITITETNGTVVSFTLEDGEDGDAKLFTLSGTLDLTNAQDAYDWYLAGKYPVLKYGSKFYYLYSASSSVLFWVIPYDKAADGSSTTGLYRDGIKMDVSSGTITTITTTTIFVANSNFLRTGVNYGTPYTPEYNGSPATKKYVDDGLSAKQATLVSGTNIKTINNTSILGSGDITISGGGSDIVYATQAEYTALLPGAESDGKHYFIYSTSGGGGWQPGVNTLAYYKLEGDANDYSGNGYNGTWNGTSNYATLTGGKVAAQFDYNASTVNYIYSSLSTAPKTVSFWMKLDSLDTSNYQDFKQLIGQVSAEAGTWQLRGYIGIGNNCFIPNGTNLSYTWTTNWIYVTMLLDGTTISLYVNGTKLGDVTNTSTASSGTLYIGGNILGGNLSMKRALSGKMSEVILESELWTEQNITDYFNQTKSTYGIS